MRVLITGGAGYIGSGLVERLSANDAISQIIIYDNLSRGNYNMFIGNQGWSEKIKFVEGDILDSRSLQKAVDRSDVVAHIAAKVTTPFADQSPHLFEQVNHWGTAELTYAVERSEVKKLIYLSSVSVYGAGSEEKTLDSEVNPRTFYGISKMRGEEHVQRLKAQKEVFVFRCGNVYGYNPSMRFDAVINKFLFEANFKGKVKINGDGSQHRAFIHIDAVATQLERAIVGQTQPDLYNLVESNFTVLEIVDAIKTLYPELETIFINHNMKLRELIVEPDPRLPLPSPNLLQQLTDFKAKFAF